MSDTIQVRGKYVRTFFRAVATVAVLAGVTALQAQMIDNFTVNDLGTYTQTPILAQLADTPPNLSFTWDNVNDALQVARTTATTAPEQDLFLRGDYSLGVGQTLTVNLLGLGTSSAVSDFGIALAAMTAPTPAIYSSANVDVRSNIVTVEVKPASSEIGANFFDGHTQIFSSHNTTASEGNTFTALTGLWISEPSAQTFSVGYTVAGTNFLYHTYAMNNGSPGDTMIGDAIGFYADVRAEITSPVELTDLQIIPEPSTFALIGAGLGFGAMLLRRKRSQA